MKCTFTRKPKQNAEWFKRLDDLRGRFKEYWKTDLWRLK